MENRNFRVIDKYIEPEYAAIIREVNHETKCSKKYNIINNVNRTVCLFLRI